LRIKRIGDCDRRKGAPAATSSFRHLAWESFDPTIASIRMNFQ